MSDRLARVANRVARRKARGLGGAEEWPTSKEAAPTLDPWADIPPEARKAEVTTLANGTVLTSYVDTLEDHKGRPAAAKLRTEEEAPAPPKRAKKDKPTAQENPWASYPMPGHGRQ